jgi:hypothetical protein
MFISCREKKKLLMLASNPTVTAIPLPLVLIVGLLTIIGKLYSASVLNSDML